MNLKGGMASYHLALCRWEESPKPCTWIHFVADHFSPLVVGQLPCRLEGSVVPSGCKLHTKQAAEHAGAKAVLPDVKTKPRLMA